MTQRLTFVVIAVATLVGAVSGDLAARYEIRAAVTSAAAPLSAPTQVPAAIAADLPGLIDRVGPSIVAIDVLVPVGFGPRTILQKGAGTGFVIASGGLLVTNAHVVAGAREITVTFADGSTAAATVVASGDDLDLAVLRVDRAGLIALPLGRSGDLRVGESVLVIGNALALEGGPTASLGIVSATGRTIATSAWTYTGLIQTDAAMNEGDSGGPLLNMRGEAVGISTAGVGGAENLGFAIAIDSAAAFLERVIAGATCPASPTLSLRARR